jgi:hypothetical protein
MTGDMGIYIVFILGIIVGGVLFNKDFRQKFFTGLRKFLGQIGGGAKHMNDQYSRTRSYRTRTEPMRSPTPRDEYNPAPRTIPKPKIIDCPTCNGIGKVQEELPSLMKGALGTQERWITCPTCEGSGRVYEQVKS